MSDTFIQIMFYLLGGAGFWWIFGHLIMGDHPLGKFLRGSFKWYLCFLGFMVVLEIVKVLIGLK